MATEQEIAEIEKYVKGNVDAIVGDVGRMKVEAATTATASLGSEIIELRKQLTEEQAKRLDTLKEGADIVINNFRERLGTL